MGDRGMGERWGRDGRVMGERKKKAGGGAKRSNWGLSQLSRPPKHAQIPLLVLQLLQDGFPLPAGGCLPLVPHAALLEPLLFLQQHVPTLAEDGFRRVWLQHGQLGVSVLYLNRGHT